LLKYEESRRDNSYHVGDNVILLCGSKHRTMTSLESTLDHRETLNKLGDRSGDPLSGYKLDLLSMLQDYALDYWQSR
jgi:hypothetical protein